MRLFVECGTSRFAGGCNFHNFADVLRICAAAAADNIHPALFYEAGECRGDHGWRFVVAAVLIRQSRVGITGDVAFCETIECAQMVGHELRSGGAIQTDGNHAGMLYRTVERVDRLPGQHCAHRFDRGRDH